MGSKEKKLPAPEAVAWGKRLKKAMHEARVAAPELAKALGVSTDMVYRYLRGEHSPRTKRLQKISEIVKKPPEYLLDGKIPPTPDQGKEMDTLGKLVAAYEKDIARLEAENTRLKQRIAVLESQKVYHRP